MRRTVPGTDGGRPWRTYGRDMTTTSPVRLPHLLVALGALYVVGIVLALAGDLATLGGAIAGGSGVNAPLPIIAAQLVGGVVALRSQGRARVAGAVLLLAACTLSLAAGASDGDLGHSGLSSGQVAYQLAIMAATAVTWILGLRVLRAGA